GEARARGGWWGGRWVWREGWPGGRSAVGGARLSGAAGGRAERRPPPPRARAARKSVNSSHPRGRTPSGLERKEGIVSSKLNVFALLVVAVAVTVASPAQAQSGALCQLAGTAGISPGLSNTDSNFTFTFSGTLSGCQS